MILGVELERRSHLTRCDVDELHAGLLFMFKKKKNSSLSRCANRNGDLATKSEKGLMQLTSAYIHVHTFSYMEWNILIFHDDLFSGNMASIFLP